jgi:cell wall-associated NlpC family hydrolase
VQFADTRWRMRANDMALRLATLLIFSATMAGCASTGAVPRPFPKPGGGTVVAPRTPPPATPPTSVPPPTPSPSGAIPVAPPVVGGGDGYAIAGSALSFRGVPYRNGGSDPSGFDCSGLVQYVFGQYGRAVSREVRELFRAGKSIDRSRLEPGDLVFFTTTAPGASHVGIALGGDQFVHAPSRSGVVRVENLSAEYWSRRFVGARRVN